MNRILRLSAMFALAGLAMASAPRADAAFVPPGNQAFADIGTPTLVGSTSITSATGFNFGSLVTTTSRDGGFTAGATGLSVATSTFNPSAPTTFTLGNAVFGTFTGVTATQIASTATTRSYLITGTFAPGTEFGGGTTQSASLSVSFTQNGGAGTAISDSATLTVPSAVPEPASIALVGLGLAGVAGFSARRRSAK